MPEGGLAVWCFTVSISRHLPCGLQAGDSLDWMIQEFKFSQPQLVIFVYERRARHFVPQLLAIRQSEPSKSVGPVICISLANIFEWIGVEFIRSRNRHVYSKSLKRFLNIKFLI